MVRFRDAFDEEIYGFILYCITVLTLIVQCCVLFLVQFRSPKQMNEYRYFLNNFMLWDMLFTIVLGTAIAPYTISYGLACLITGWAKYLSPAFQLFWAGVGMYSGSLIVMSQGYCLLYRLTVIQINKNIHRIFMSTPSKIFFVLIQQSLAIPLGVFIYFACVQPEEFSARIQQEGSPGLQQATASEHTFFLWLDLEKSSASLWFLGTIILSFVLFEITCALFIYFIMKTLRRNLNKFSKATYKLHRQFTILLAVQITSPILFVLAPTTAFITAYVVLKTYPSPWISQTAFIWMSLYGISNALFTVVYIPSYRVHCLQLLSYLNIHKFCICLKMWKGSETPVHTLSPQIQAANVSAIYSPNCSRKTYRLSNNYIYGTRVPK